jgi:eukaryotic-like serine/threonine-protein kinase
VPDANPDPIREPTTDPTTAPLSPDGHDARTVSTRSVVLEQPGDQIGPFHLLKLVGEGGFGVVYLAERRHPIHQRVALKVIKPGMDTRLVVARFEQERQALAVMDHPGVAKVLDAGSTPTGRPYFAMEFVQGEPINEYCDKRTLGTRERLGLFVQVCEAVQHAHQRGIIHRDLKPSNILVLDSGASGGTPRAKVIDFGIAKAIGRDLTARTAFTEHGQLIGTPEYMSPEQAGGGTSALDLDTRTDVYSLGVVLYELLVGSLPFDSATLRSAGFAEIQRVIREVEPPRPSTRLSQMGAAAVEAARLRRTALDQLRRELTRELEWIPLMAMRKDRGHRYRSPEHLADDIRNYLEGRPLFAGPESAAYRARKFVRRHRVGAAAGSLIALALTAGVVGIGVGYVRATDAAEQARLAAERANDFADRERIAAARASQETQRAVEAAARERDAATHANELAASERVARADEKAQRERAEATMTFLLQMLASVDPEKTKGREVTVRDMLDAAAGTVGVAMKNQPFAEASLRSTIGQTYFQLGLFHEAAAQLRLAADLDDKNVGPEHKEAMTTRHNLAAALFSIGTPEAAAEAKGMLEAVYERRARVLGPHHADTLASLSLLGYAAQSAGDLEGALKVYRQTFEAQKTVAGPRSRDAIDTLASIADTLQHLGRLEEAEREAGTLVREATASLGEDHRLTMTGLSIHAAILRDMGRYADAERLGREALAIKRRVLGDEHPDTLTTMNVLGIILEKGAKYAESVEVLRGAVEACTKVRGAEHDVTLVYRANLGRSLHLAGKMDEGEAMMRETLAARRALSGDTNVSTLSLWNNLGLLMLDRKTPGADAEAVEIFATITPMLDGAMAGTHWIVGQVRVNHAEALAAQGKTAEARGLAAAGLEKLRAALPAGHDRIVKAEGLVERLKDR